MAFAARGRLCGTFFARTLGPVALILLTACGPSASATFSPPDPSATAAGAALPAPTATPQPSATAVPSPTVQTVATSRGPELEATDPTTVSLASGELHFVEFFRFT